MRSFGQCSEKFFRCPKRISFLDLLLTLCVTVAARKQASCIVGGCKGYGRYRRHRTGPMWKSCWVCSQSRGAAEVTLTVCFSRQGHVYSLGMTLYWAAGFRVPPSQVCGQGHQVMPWGDLVTQLGLAGDGRATWWLCSAGAAPSEARSLLGSGVPWPSHVGVLLATPPFGRLCRVVSRL